MAKITNLKQAINKTLPLLDSDEYQNYKDVFQICLKLIAQARILELYERGEDKDTIANGTGLREKTIRFWLNADQRPTLRNFMRLEDYYKKVKRRRSYN